jgi:hypothetical protein
MPTRGSVVGWGTMLQAGRSRVRFLVRSLDFFNWPNPSRRTMALGSVQPLTEMSIRNIPGCKGRPVRKAYSLTAICELIWEPLRLTTLWASTVCYRDSLSTIDHCGSRCKGWLGPPLTHTYRDSFTFNLAAFSKNILWHGKGNTDCYCTQTISTSLSVLSSGV